MVDWTQVISVTVGAAAAGFVYLVGRIVIDRRRNIRRDASGVRRQYTETGWPIVTAEEIKATDEVLREVSGMNEEEKRRERIRQVQGARVAGARK